MTDPNQIIPTRNMSAEDAAAWLRQRIETGCMSEVYGYAVEAVLGERVKMQGVLFAVSTCKYNGVGLCPNCRRAAKALTGPRT